MQRRPAIVAYDISDNAARRRALRVLGQWRVDGQRSVHECLLTAAEAEELFIQLGELIAETDSLVLAWVETRRAMAARGAGSCQGLVATLLRVA